MKILNSSVNIPMEGFTHGGRFHADDVFSTALLRLLNPEIKITRGFMVPENFAGIVFDIGNGKFDHHQKDRECRENGVPYAAFGLLWREYGKCFLGQEEQERFDEKFVQPLDLDDNTGSGNILAGAIGAFNPNWDSEESQDDAFEEAVEVAYKILEKKLNSLMALERGKVIVEESLTTMQDNILVMEKYVPWKPVLVPSDAEFVIFPSMRGGYSLQCIPKDFNGKTGNKVPLPKVLWGASQQDLVRFTGIEDMQFCHASGFMATVGSLESARKLALFAKNEYAKRQEQSAKQKAKNMVESEEE